MMLLLFLLLLDISGCEGKRKLNPYTEIPLEGTEAYYFEEHPNLITCGLRRVATGGTSADFILIVYHKRATPYEMPIENIKERSDAPYYAIRLFMKSDKRMFVAYETKSSETILAEYQLRKNGLVHVDSRNAGRFIDTWRITDSEEGFYDALTCQMFGTTDKHPNCPCRVEIDEKLMCVYDHFRKVYEQIKQKGNETFRVTFNAYNCLHFHEGEDKAQLYCEDNDPQCIPVNLTALTYITHYKELPLVNDQYGICLYGMDNTRQMQYYDLKWDIPGQLPKSMPKDCTTEYILTLAELANKTVSIPEEEEPENPIPKEKEAAVEQRCWTPVWTVALFCLDGVLFLAAIFVFLAGGMGRDAKRRKY